MPQPGESLFRKLFIVVVVLNELICPLANSGLVQRAAGQGARQVFPTPLPVTGTVATPFGTPVSGPSPVAALEPGQYFESDEIDKTKIVVLHGDDEFGYGEYFGYQDLYVIWITDDMGTHYFVVDEDSEILFGRFDGKTVERRNEESFSYFVMQRDSVLTDLDCSENDIQNLRGSRNVKMGFGIGIVVVGVGICAVATGGVCGIAVAAGAPVALGLFAGTGVDENDRRTEIADNSDLQEDLEIVENKLLGKFMLATIEANAP